MTLKEARALRDEIREAKYECVVPTGRPASEYFVELRGHIFNRRFHTREAWLEFKKERQLV